jgi:hypothetical protein
MEDGRSGGEGDSDKCPWHVIYVVLCLLLPYAAQGQAARNWRVHSGLLWARCDHRRPFSSLGFWLHCPRRCEHIMKYERAAGRQFLTRLLASHISVSLKPKPLQALKLCKHTLE